MTALTIAYLEKTAAQLAANFEVFKRRHDEAWGHHIAARDGGDMARAKQMLAWAETQGQARDEALLLWEDMRETLQKLQGDK